MNELILASASPRRVELLQSLRVMFEWVPSRAEEIHDLSISAVKLCDINAERKADEVARRYPDRIVLGADTLVILDGQAMGKPRDLRHAKEMLAELSGKTHQVVTGVCLSSAKRKSIFSETTEVRFKPLTPAIIEDYISRVHVLDKAGAYGIQEEGEMIVAGITGSFSNVVGLPLERLAKEFDNWGIPYNKRSL